MVVQNLIASEYSSKEARMFFLKQRANEVSSFIRGLRGGNHSMVYKQIMAGVTGIESLVTLQSFLLQTALYYRKNRNPRLNEVLEIHRAYEALAKYYRENDYSEVVTYMQEIKQLFEMVKE